MTDEERKLFRAYLLEMRRHLLAQAKACDVLMAAMADEEIGYNMRIQVDDKIATVAGVKEFVK